MMRKTQLLAVLAALILTACASSSTNEDSSEPPRETEKPVENPPPTSDEQPFLSDQDGDPVILAGYTVDGGAVTASGGFLDPTSDAFSLGLLSGSIDVTAEEITLSDGRIVTLTELGDYIARYAVEGGETGIVGIAANTIPTTGSATYNGDAFLTIIAGNAIYDLTGTTKATALFGDDEIDVTISNLDGIRTTIGGDTAVTDVATVEIQAAQIQGPLIGNGTAVITSDTAGIATSGNEALVHLGSFFGSGAEVGGAFVVDDTVDGDLSLRGTYTGK